MKFRGCEKAILLYHQRGEIASRYFASLFIDPFVNVKKLLTVGRQLIKFGNSNVTSRYHRAICRQFVILKSLMVHSVLSA